MLIPVRPLRGRWPAMLERRLSRFFWSDPSDVLDDDVTDDEFRTAMSAFNVGSTIKITGTNRHPTADALLLDHVDVTRATIVDIGASDGSTSVDLVGKLPDFKAYVIADLYFYVTATRVGTKVLFFDPPGACILVVGRRLVAWPSISRGVRLLYAPLIALAARHPERRQEVLLLNPSAKRLIADDERVTFAVHDVFEAWDGVTPDVIKVANLLRRLYFSDAEIMRALQAVLKSLPEGGHLLIVDNARARVAPRAGLYRRLGGRFTRVAETETSAEIADLVSQVAL